MSTRGACGFLVVHSMGHLGKKNSKFIWHIICLWNFWNRPKNKKVSFLELPRATRQLPGVPVSAQACPVSCVEIFKNFWNWICTFRQSLLVKKTQFELNLKSFKWPSAWLGPWCWSSRTGIFFSIHWELFLYLFLSR